VSFVCSVGNVPLAAVLWRGGISFGGVVSFIFADLIVLPILDIYRRYYGGRVALYILGTFYVTMAVAGYIVEIVFGALGIIPTNRAISAISEGPSWNYTTVLNIVFLMVAAVLVLRFLRTGGPAMLRMMNTPEEEMAQHDHALETEQQCTASAGTVPMTATTDTLYALYGMPPGHTYRAHPHPMYCGGTVRYRVWRSSPRPRGVGASGHVTKKEPVLVRPSAFQFSPGRVARRARRGVDR